MQHGAALGLVDLLAREHRVALGSHALRLCQRDQHVAACGVNIGLGIIQQHLARSNAEIGCAVRVLGEQLQHMPCVGGALVLGQIVPCAHCLCPSIRVILPRILKKEGGQCPLFPSLSLCPMHLRMIQQCRNRGLIGRQFARAL